MNGAMEGGPGQFQFRDLIERIKQQVGNDNELVARDASQLYGPQSQDMAGCPIARCLEN
jgi:hypothetical protein